MEENEKAQQEQQAVAAMLADKAPFMPILEFFSFGHLSSPELRHLSFTFARQALFIVENVPGSAERTVGLRKLLESKDATVRAKLSKLGAGT